MNLEDELRTALRRQNAPAGFSERILDRTRWRLRAWWAAAIAAALIMSIGISVEDQRAKEERAGRQAILALRIAAEKLNHARSQILKTEN